MFRTTRFLPSIIALSLMGNVLTSPDLHAETATHYWHGDTAGIEWHPNGKNLSYHQADPKIHPDLTAHSLKMNQGVYKIADNVYQTYGFALCSTAFFVGPSGVLVIDPPEDVIKGQNALAAFREYSDKPIVGVLYSHSHIDHYGGVRAFVSDEDMASGRVQVIAHRDFLKNLMATKTMGLGPLVAARANYTLGTLLPSGPDGRVNSGLGPDFVVEKLSLIAPNVIIDDVLDTNIGGLDVHFEWLPSESPDEIATWFPQLNILHSAEILQGESFPNLHTIRGTRYRLPDTWFRSIDKMRRFPADYMVLSHGRPIAGKDHVASFLEAYRDAIQYVYDQTLRFMNMGYLPDQLVEAVTLPDHLANHPYLGDFYGGVEHAVRQIYVGEMGWFNGDPTTLAPLPSQEASKRYLALMGGRDKVYSEADQASRNDDPQWSAELLTHLLNVDPNDRAARQLKADNLRQLAYRLTNTNWRNWLLTSALELEGNLDFSKALNTASPDLVRAFPSQAIIEGLRFKVDGPRAAADAINLSINFSVSDEDVQANITLRNGVAAFQLGHRNNSDAHIAMTRRQLLGQARQPNFAKALADNKATLLSGEMTAVSSFDKYLDTANRGPIKLTTRN